jgi:hypothetical protein
MSSMLYPVHTVIACGTWSDPSFSRFGRMVEIVNAGVSRDQPHSNHWQYMACAFTALCAHLCNHRNWDVLIFLEPDLLVGAVDWDALLCEFMSRPEEVFGPAWYERHCDFIGWKPAAVRRFLHSRLRPNLTEDESVMWLDDEWATMFSGRAWNPWPACPTIRRDHGHEGGPAVRDEDTLLWPFVRLPHPDWVARYEAECSVLAKPLKEA